MAPQTAKTLMKEFRASFRRKKTVVEPKSSAIKEAEEEELTKLIELKENMGEPLYSDAALLGFLRARSLNVKETEKLVKLDENIKRFLLVRDYKPSEVMLRYSFSGVIGFDKEGSLVRVINVGSSDTKGILNAFSTIQSFTFLIWMMEQDTSRLHNQNNKTGKKSQQFVYILNMEGLSMSQVSYKPAFDTAVQALKLLQDHYHDSLKAVYFIHGPSFFSSAFKLFRPFIKDALHQKMKILDHEHWKEELLNQVDADVLPRSLGGNRVDSNGDPGCSEIVSVGSTVPENLYATNFLDVDNPEVVVATVSAGATLNFRYPVRQVGTILRWHVQAKDNDIGVALFREPFQSGTETPRTRKKREEDMSRFEALTPIIRCQCHICPEEGATILWFTGNLVLHFDNTYSWMSSKEVYFKISLHALTEAEKDLLRAADSVTRALGEMTLAC